MASQRQSNRFTIIDEEELDIYENSDELNRSTCNVKNDLLTTDAIDCASTDDQMQLSTVLGSDDFKLPDSQSIGDTSSRTVTQDTLNED